MFFEPGVLMKQLFAVFFMAMIWVSGNTQSLSSPAKPVKQLLHVNETSYDFGQIQQSRPVTHEFLIQNNSDDTLRLENVLASCGCTTPAFKKDPVKPGGTTSINVGYNAASEGPFEKLITIYFNAGQTKTLTIKGDVFKTPATPAPTNSSIQLLKQTSH